jgi:hypothetical protein
MTDSETVTTGMYSRAHLRLAHESVYGKCPLSTWSIYKIDILEDSEIIIFPYTYSPAGPLPTSFGGRRTWKQGHCPIHELSN